MEIVIDKEFRDALRQLTIDEYAELETSIRKNGCYDSIKVWEHKGEFVLVDGHHRHEICEKLDVSTTVRLVEFSSRKHALDFIYSNQIGRRNESDFSKIIQSESEDLETAKEIQSNENNQESSGNSADFAPADSAGISAAKSHNSANTTSVARHVGLSARQVEKAKRIAKEATPEVVAAAEAGDISINAAYETLNKKNPAKKTNCVTDAFGHPVSKELEEIFKGRKILNAMKKKILDLTKEVEECCEEPWAYWLRDIDVERSLSKIKVNFNFAKPHCPCPNCKGKVGEKCDYCEGCGFLTFKHMNSMLPEKVKWVKERK